MDWYEGTVGNDSVNAVADRAGVVQSTLNRQVRSGALSVEMVVAVARAYKADVLDALVAVGFITRDDIRRHGAQVALRDADDWEIADEVTRRLAAGPAPDFD